MRAHVVLVFQLIAIYSCNNAQMFGGLGAQLQAAQMQRYQQAQLQQAQLQQAQLQQAQLQQQQAAMMQQQMSGMGQLGQPQGLSGGQTDEEARRGKGGRFGFGFGGFRPFGGFGGGGFNPFLPPLFPGFGMPGFGMGMGGFGGIGPFGMNPFGGMFRGTTNLLQGGGSANAGGQQTSSANTGGQQTNAQLQQFMDQMNEKFNQREQDFDRMKDDFLIELGQKLKEQYGNQVTEAEVQLYLKNVGEQLRTMYGQEQPSTEASTTPSAGNSGQQQQSPPTGLKPQVRQTSRTSQKNDQRPIQTRG